MTWQGSGILGDIWKLKNSSSLWLQCMCMRIWHLIIVMTSHNRGCAEQDLHANVRKLYTDTSEAGQRQIVTFVGYLP